MLKYLERLQRSSLPVPDGHCGMVAHRHLALEVLDSRCMLSAAPGDTIVTFNTSLGTFQVELYNSSAPQTVANFLNYVDAGDYDNTFFHRIVDTLASSGSPAFQIVQGGGYSVDGAPFSIYPPVNGPTHIDNSQQATLPNEFSTTDPDAVGTIAMALSSNSTGVPNPTSGTSEWFFNVSDNTDSLGPAQQKGVGFAVFGKVLGNGMSIIDQIVAMNTLNDLAGASGSTYISSVFHGLSTTDQNTVATFAPTPVTNFDIDSGQPISASNLVVINSITHPSITGTVFNDANGNGTQDTGEQGLTGVTVYADINGDNKFDAGDDSAITDSSGNYTITNLTAGTYTIRVAPSNGLTTSSPASGGITVTLAQGQLSTSNNFGETLAAPSIPILPAQFDTGKSSSDALTNLSSLQFQITGVLPGATVQLFDTVGGTTLVGTAVATANTVTIATSSPLAEGEHLLIAKQSFGGVTSVNSGPRSVIIDTVAPQIVTATLPVAEVGTPYSSTVTTDDPGGAGFSLTSPPNGLSVGATSGVLTWSPSNAQIGHYQVTIVTTDLAGNASQKTLALDVDGTPQFVTIGDQTVNQGATLTITPSVATIHGPLTYSLEDGAPSDATVDPTTGKVVWTPTAADAAGVHQITIDVRDALGRTASSGPINVLVNAPPVFVPVTDLTVDEQAPISLPLSIADQSTVALSFAGAAPLGAAVNWTSQSPGTGVFVDNAGVFTWTPSEAQGPGTFTIQIKATDAAGLSTILPFQVTVNEIDTPPVFSPLAPVNATQGATARIQVTATDADIPSQQVIYSLDPGAPQGALIDPQTGLLTWDIPAQFTPGAVTISVRATEVGGQGLSVTLPVVVNVGLNTVTAFNGFDLFTTGAVQLGGFAQGLAIDNGVNINVGLSISPFGSSLPGGLPAQAAALAQLAGIPPVGTPSTDLGTAGHLAAGIVDMVLGFDAGVPHNTEGMEIEELAREAGSGGGGLGVPGAPGGIQKAGATEPINADDGGHDPRHSSSRLQRTIPVPADSQDTSHAALFWGPAGARWHNQSVGNSSTGLFATGRISASHAGDYPRLNNYEEHARIAKRSAAAAALMMPLLVADLPEKRAQAKRNRFRRLLDPLNP